MSNKLALKIGTRLGNVDDLPEFLQKEIPEFSVSGIDEQIYSVLKNELEGVATLSEILVALYRKHNITDKTRAEITTAIYRLMRKKLVEKVEGRKGVYNIVGVLLDNRPADEIEYETGDKNSFELEQNKIQVE